jgi:hypothetical protein
MPNVTIAPAAASVAALRMALTNAAASTTV